MTVYLVYERAKPRDLLWLVCNSMEVADAQATIYNNRYPSKDGFYWVSVPVEDKAT